VNKIRDKKNKKIIKKQDIKNSEESQCKDIESWLNNNGFQKYTDIFIREEIDMDTLTFITENDLEKLGISHLGARKKILAAINKLKKKDISSVEEKLREEIKSLVVSVDKLSTSVDHISKTLEQLTACSNVLLTPPNASNASCGQFDFSSNDDKRKIKDQLQNKQ